MRFMRSVLKGTSIPSFFHPRAKLVMMLTGVLMPMSVQMGGDGHESLVSAVSDATCAGG